MILPKQIERILYLSSLSLIQIVLLAYYAEYSRLAQNSTVDAQNYYNLSVAGSLFMLLSLFATFVLNFYYHVYIIFGDISFSLMGLFLLLVGCGIGAEDYNQMFKTTKYNLPVAFWFAEVGLWILIVLQCYNYYAEQQNSKKVEHYATNVTQQSVQQ